MNTKKQGDVGLGKAIAYFTSLGYTVSIPLSDSQDYDLIYDDGKSLKRLQIKTTSFKKGGKYYHVSLTVKGGNRSGIGKVKKFNKLTVDEVFVYCYDGKHFLIPVDKIKSDNSILLNENMNIFCLSDANKDGWSRQPAVTRPLKGMRFNSFHHSPVYSRTINMEI